MDKKYIIYDPRVIEEFATRLYKKASSIIITSTLFGVISGAIIGAGGVILLKAQGSLNVALFFGIVLGGFLGYMRGTERAFLLKLQAQVALCQINIEKNTSGKNS